MLKIGKEKEKLVFFAFLAMNSPTPRDRQNRHSYKIYNYYFLDENKNFTIHIYPPPSDIELYEINDFLTHDDIKDYKQDLTMSPFTPYLAHDGDTIMNHGELVKAAQCPEH